MKQSTTLIYVVVVAIVVAAAVLFGTGKLSVTGSGTDEEVPAVGCSVAPTVDLSAFNAQVKSTTVTPTYYAKINGGLAQVIADGGSVPDNSEVQIFTNHSAYLNTFLSSATKVKCGANPISVPMYKNASLTLEIQEDSTTLTDAAAGGAANFSNVAIGGADTFTLKITGQSEASTGDLVVIIEMGDTQNVSSIEMSGASSTTVPQFYRRALSNPLVKAFSIPASLGSTEKKYEVTFDLRDTKDITGGVYVTVYQAQAYVTDDGNYATGIEDEDGDTKYAATFDYDFLIAAS